MQPAAARATFSEASRFVSDDADGDAFWEPTPWTISRRIVTTHYSTPAASLGARVHPPLPSDAAAADTQGPGVCRTDPSFGAQVSSLQRSEPQISFAAPVNRGARLQSVQDVEHGVSPGPGTYNVDWHSLEKEARRHRSENTRARARSARLSRWKWRHQNNCL
jgi:hypothetical protein